MSIALLIALTNAFAALVAYVTNHNILCGVNIVLAIIFIFSAIASEGKTLNRIKKLEEELDILKRRH